MRTITPTYITLYYGYHGAHAQRGNSGGTRRRCTIVRVRLAYPAAPCPLPRLHTRTRTHPPYHVQALFFRPGGGGHWSTFARMRCEVVSRASPSYLAREIETRCEAVARTRLCKQRNTMVESSLRGRASFKSILQSETRSGEDRLTYYDYQRFLRYKKVARLQERRADNLHVFPCHKRTVFATPGNTSQLKSKCPVLTKHIGCADTVGDCGAEPTSSTKDCQTGITFTDSIGSSVSPVHVASASAQLSVAQKPHEIKHSDSEQLPSISAHHRRQLIKSARVRDHHRLSASQHESEKYRPRPKSVAGDRSITAQTTELATIGTFISILGQ